MAHFSVIVIGEDTELELIIHQDIRVIKDQHQKNPSFSHLFKLAVLNYKIKYYDEYIKSKEIFTKRSNKQQLDYLENYFPLLLKWCKESIVAEEEKHLFSFSDSENINLPEMNKHKFDWYELGGRYQKKIILRDVVAQELNNGKPLNYKLRVDQAKKSDISNYNDLKAFALLIDGTWYEIGDVYDDYSKEDKEKWEKRLKRLMKDVPDDDYIAIYDCHFI